MKKQEKRSKASLRRETEREMQGKEGESRIELKKITKTVGGKQKSREIGGARCETFWQENCK